MIVQKHERGQLGCALGELLSNIFLTALRKGRPGGVAVSPHHSTAGLRRCCYCDDPGDAQNFLPLYS